MKNNDLFIIYKLNKKTNKKEWLFSTVLEKDAIEQFNYEWKHLNDSEKTENELLLVKTEKNNLLADEFLLDKRTKEIN